jgi:hypothetical protein
MGGVVTGIPGLKSADDESRAFGGGGEDPVELRFEFSVGSIIVVADIVFSGIAPHAALPMSSLRTADTGNAHNRVVGPGMLVVRGAVGEERFETRRMSTDLGRSQFKSRV